MIERPHLPGRGGAFDPRRVTVLNQVTLDQQNPTTFPGSVSMSA